MQEALSTEMNLSSTQVNLVSTEINLVPVTVAPVATTHECVDCGTIVDISRGNPVQFLLPSLTGGPSLRFITVAGAEVHRCRSPFMFPTFQ